VNNQSACAMCAHIAKEMPGGWLFEDERWVVGLLDGLEVPGWVVVILRRHAVGVGGLDESELTSFGPTMAKVSNAVYLATKAEKVYFASFGESFPHFHVLLMARPADVPVQHRGAMFQPHIADYRDERAARQTADSLRKILAV
jgi:diadenosine tetraphosphate (Ap4A) HIT family hydrolase